MDKECILVVDDTDALRNLLGDFLRSRGYDVVTALNGRDALVMCDLVAVDLVLTDLDMAEMNGRELAQAIVRRGSLIPFVFITGSGRVKELTPEMTAAAYLEKPFAIETLATIVDDVMRAARVSAKGHRQHSRRGGGSMTRPRLMSSSPVARLPLGAAPLRVTPGLGLTPSSIPVRVQSLDASGSRGWDRGGTQAQRLELPLWQQVVADKTTARSHDVPLLRDVVVHNGVP